MNMLEHGVMGVTGRDAALRRFSDLNAKLTGRLNECTILEFPREFSGHCGGHLDVGDCPSVMLREKMEILIYALGASYAARSQQECLVTEPEEFQPLNLQWLRNSADNKPSRSSSRRDAYIPKTA